MCSYSEVKPREEEKGHAITIHARNKKATEQFNTN